MQNKRSNKYNQYAGISTYYKSAKNISNGSEVRKNISKAQRIREQKRAERQAMDTFHQTAHQMQIKQSGNSGQYAGYVTFYKSGQNIPNGSEVRISNAEVRARICTLNGHAFR